MCIYSIYIYVHRSSLYGQNCKPAAPKQHKHVDLYSWNSSSLDHSSVPKNKPNIIWVAQLFWALIARRTRKRSPKPHLLTWAISSNDIVVSYLRSWVLRVLEMHKSTTDFLKKIATATAEIVDYYIVAQLDYFNAIQRSKVSFQCNIDA